MTFKIFLSAVSVLALIACNNRHTPDNSKQEVPKALEDKNNSMDIVSKRKDGEDLVETLYDELVSKDTKLKNLEERLDALNKSRDDSASAFDQFNGKNESYYRSANEHVAAIKDSVLRGRMRELVANHLAKYQSSIARHHGLLTTIESNHVTIADLHGILQIVRTLPLMEKYQVASLPSTTSLEGYIKQQDGTIKLVDTLTKK